MLVTVRGRKKSKLAEEDLFIVRDLVKFSAELMLKPRVVQALTVRVTFDDTLFKVHGRLGSAIWIDTHIRGREFEIELDSEQSFASLLRSVAHEMVHVKQWASGEWQQRHRPEESYRYGRKTFDATKMDYWDYPWEIEAFGRTPGIIARWSKSRGYDREVWARLL